MGNKQQIELIWSGSGLAVCRLVYSITPAERDVKGGETVCLALDVRPRRCYSGMRLAK